VGVLACVGGDDDGSLPSPDRPQSCGTVPVASGHHGGQADGSAPPYQIIWSGYSPSVQALQDVMQNPASGEVMGDVPNYYQGAPDAFVGEVLG